MKTQGQEWRKPCVLGQGSSSTRYLSPQHMMSIHEVLLPNSQSVFAFAQSQTSVTQLLSGGLDAKFWKNQWLVGTPIIHRVDPQVRRPPPTACRKRNMQEYSAVRVRIVQTIYCCIFQPNPAEEVGYRPQTQIVQLVRRTINIYFAHMFRHKDVHSPGSPFEALR